MCWLVRLGVVGAAGDLPLGPTYRSEACADRRIRAAARVADGVQPRVRVGARHRAGVGEAVGVPGQGLVAAGAELAGRPVKTGEFRSWKVSWGS